jgi:hypothetical protein
MLDGFSGEFDNFSDDPGDQGAVEDRLQKLQVLSMFRHKRCF